ncbi:MAG: gamma-glutamylcyclotransferase [Gammaproteobacteria bacterium]
MNASVWIFGYGSLVWRPDFPHVEAVPAWISGYERRFWQASTDHRGTPARPGRVATLVEAPGLRCRGIAYRITPGSAADVLAYLDHREKNGYLSRRLSLELDDGRRIGAVTYIADPRGIHFAGPAPLEEIARQIRQASGPSGANVEYVVRLADALRHLGVAEDETLELDAMLRGGAQSGA